MKNCYIQKKITSRSYTSSTSSFLIRSFHPLSPYTPKMKKMMKSNPSTLTMPWREKKGALELDHLPHNRNQGEREPASSSEPSYHTENFGLQEYIYFLISSIYVQIKLHTNIQLHCLLGSTSSPPRKLRGRSWLLEVCSLRAPTIHGHFRPYSTISKGKRGIRELF